MTNFHKIYLTGIGGIGMSALAQLLKSRGAEVTGSDRENSPVVEMLEKKGIKVFIGHSENNVTKDYEILVYSDAVFPENVERKMAQKLGILQMSYFEMLGKISEGMRTIAVSGTHGKTTTTAMLALILKNAGKSPTAIVGSIVNDFESNFLEGENDILVVEACEYKNHFLQLSPEILIINNVEWDHTDFFDSLRDLQKTFAKMAERVPTSGFIITNPSDENIKPILKNVSAKVIDYTKEIVPELSVLGEFNKDNARAARAAAHAAFPDISEKIIDDELSSYKGSWRRFEFKGKTSSGSLIYDDYAHHPTAVRKTIKATREKFPDKKIIVAFHPHLYSRTHDLMNDFAKSLSLADEVVLAPIYGAREEPIKGVTSEVLSQKINKLETRSKAFNSLDEVYDFIDGKKYSQEFIILTMGAGDIYKVADRLAKV